MGKLFQTFVELLFPPRCVFCRRFLKSGEHGICADCRETAPSTGADALVTGPFGTCAAPYYYRDNVREAIHRFKFQGAANYAEPFGREMARVVRERLAGRYDLITWVPVSARRLKTRGYDQSQLLAYAMALELDDVAAETIRKTAENRTQSEIKDEAERRANVADAFAVPDRELVEGKRVLLVDDILTSGATLGECAKMLGAAGAAEVLSVVLARVKHGSR